MSKPSHAPKAASNLDDFCTVSKHIPELFEAIKQLKPLLTNSHLRSIDRKAASLTKTLKAGKEAIDLMNYHQQANEEVFSELADAILKLRPILSHFRDHNFVGVPQVKKSKIKRAYKRSWWDTDALHSLVYGEEPLRKAFSEERIWIRQTKPPLANIKLFGKWLNNSGFYTGEYIRVLALNGLLILCPESFPDERELKAVIESNRIFTKVAV